MAFTFDSDSGSTTANSYISVDDAEDYFAGSTQSEKWDELEPSFKEKHLVSATRTLNSEIYGGIKATTSQALEWPRIGVTDYNGYPLSGVPQKLKDAVCELVTWNLSERLLDDFELESFESYSVGPIDVTTRAGAKKKYPDSVSTLLNSIGPGAWNGKKTSWDMSR